MQTTLRVRRRYTSAQKDEILADYQRSQLTQKEFAARAGIGHSTLTLWLSKAPMSPKVTAAQDSDGSAFVPVPNLFSAPAGPPAYRLKFPRGLTVEVAAGFRTRELGALLKLAQRL